MRVPGCVARSLRERSRSLRRDVGSTSRGICAVCRRNEAEERCPGGGAHLLCDVCRENPLWAATATGGCPACALTATEEKAKEAAAASTCTVCLQAPTAETRLFQCTRGHVVCGDCIERLNERCPSCREPMPTVCRIRCLAAEQQAAAWDRTRCPQCGETTSKSAMAAGKHECPAVEERLVSERYLPISGTAKAVEIFYSGLRGQERVVEPSPVEERGSLAVKVFGNRVERYVTEDGRTYLRSRETSALGCASRCCREKGKCSCRYALEHFDASGRRLSLKTQEEHQSFFADGVTLSSQTKVDEKKGHLGDTVFFDESGEVVERVLRSRGAETGQRVCYADGEMCSVAYTAPDTRNGEVHHFEKRGDDARDNSYRWHARTTFVAPSVRVGQVAHFFPSRGGEPRTCHRITSFESGHARAGDLVFFTEDGQHFATWKAAGTRTLRSFVASPKRLHVVVGSGARCFLCGVRQCPCLRAMLCLTCFERARRIALYGKCPPRGEREEGAAAAVLAPRAQIEGEASVVVVRAAANRTLVGCQGLRDPLSASAPLTLRVCLEHAEGMLGASPGSLCLPWDPREMRTVPVSLD